MARDAAYSTLRYIDRAEDRRLVRLADLRPEYVDTLRLTDRLGRLQFRRLGGLSFANFMANVGVGRKQVPGEFWTLTVTNDGFPCAEVACQCGETPIVEALAPHVDCACGRAFFFDGADVWAFNTTLEGLSRRATPRLQFRPNCYAADVVAAANPTQQNLVAATRAVARSYRRRSALTAALAAFLASAVVTIPSVLLITHQTGQEATRQAGTNCETVAKARPAGNARAVVQQAMLEAVGDNSTNLAQVNMRLVKDHKLAPQLPTHVDAVTDLEPYLQPLPLINCQVAIGR